MKDTIRTIRKKRQLAAPFERGRSAGDYYDEDGEPIKVLVYSLPDKEDGEPIDKDMVSCIFAQYGDVVRCATIANGRALIYMKTVQESQWIVENLHWNVPQGLDRPIGCVYATPENIRKSRHRA